MARCGWAELPAESGSNRTPVEPKVPLYWRTASFHGVNVSAIVKAEEAELICSLSSVSAWSFPPEFALNVPSEVATNTFPVTFDDGATSEDGAAPLSPVPPREPLGVL